MKIQQLSPILQNGAKTKKGRKAKARPIYSSKKAEIEYLSQLLKIVNLVHSDIKQSIIQIVRQHRIGDSKSVRANDSILSIFITALSALRLKYNSMMDQVALDIAQRVIEQNKVATDKQLAQIIFSSTGIDLTSLMTAEALATVITEAIAVNVALIKSLPTQTFDKIEQIVLNGLQSGQRAESMIKDIQDLGAKDKKRAALVARDQMGKITSRLTQVRQEKMGITHYYWSHSKDDSKYRRLHHVARHGKLFAWNKPPDDGHPGIAICCCCVAIPYTAHLFNPDAPTPEEIMAMQEAA